MALRIHSTGCARPAIPSARRSSRPAHPRLRGIVAMASGNVSREVLSRGERSKLDDTDDRQFYSSPRICKHVDDQFLAQVTQLYRERIPEDGAVLDLMSSWISHLPPEKKYSRVAGHGMNAEELVRNKRLDTFFVRNLNESPNGWAFADQSFDAVTCCVSVQYLQQPEKVFAEIYRVLKPGGCCIITFSNRMFYEKAVSAWRDSSGYSRSQLVKSYIMAVEGFTTPEAVTEVAAPKTQSLPGFLQVVERFFQRSSSDPFYAVVAYRNYKRTD